MKKLSPEMVKGMQLLKENKGTIIRYKGGFWSHPGVEKSRFSDGMEYPSRHVGKGTLEALANRGLVEPTDWNVGVPGRPDYAIKYELTKEGHAYES